MKKINLISSLIVMIVAIVFFLDTLSFPSIKTQEIGAAMIPQIYCVILFLLALILFIKTIWEKNPEGDLNLGGNLKVVVLSMGLVVIYLIIFPFVGFYISTLLFVFTLLWSTKVRSTLTLICVPIGVDLFIFATFQKILYVPLPTGIFF